MTARYTPLAVKLPFLDDEEDDLSIEYPSSDGEPMAESDYQYTAMTETISTMRELYRGQPDIYVAGDMLMYYRKNDNVTRVAPDVFVVFGAAGNHRRDSWIVWREGKAPDFVMEMASASTWRRDITEKRPIYAAMGVTEYWRFDATGRYFAPALVGERLVDGEYQPIPITTDADGILRGHSEVLGLDICVKPGLELRLYDPQSGQWLRTHQETEEARQAEAAARQAAEDAKERASAARQAAEEAQQREAEARQAAETEMQAAEDARQSEAEARQAAEEEIRRLREQLDRLQSGPQSG